MHDYSVYMERKISIYSVHMERKIFIYSVDMERKMAIYSAHMERVNGHLLSPKKPSYAWTENC